MSCLRYVVATVLAITMVACSNENGDLSGPGGDRSRASPARSGEAPFGDSAEGSVGGSIEGSAAEGATSSVLDQPSTPIDEIDFDLLYRELDATRMTAYETEDPGLLAQVSSNRQSIAEWEAEAADADTYWDMAEQNYVIDQVEVYEVIDDNNVMLYVEDTSTGTWVKRDSNGEVVEAGVTRDVPRLGFMVWMELVEGRWKIVRDYRVQLGFPAVEEFVAIDEIELDDDVGVVTVGLRAAAVDNGICFLVQMPTMPYYPGCLTGEVGNGPPPFAAVLVDRTGAYEAIVLVAAGTDWSYRLVMAERRADGENIVVEAPLGTALGDTEVALSAGVQGAHIAFRMDTPHDDFDGFSRLTNMADLSYLSLRAAQYWAGELPLDG